MWKRSWEFLKELAWPFGILGGIYGLVSRFIDTSLTFNLLGMLAICVALLAVIICLWGYVVRAAPKSDHPKIAIQQVRSGGGILIAEKTSALGVNMGAMIYLKEGAYERHIATGGVTHVQTDGLIQIEVRYVPSAEDELIQKISQNTAETISSLIVRPGIVMIDVPTSGESA